jgi:hypothetical protein
VIVLLYTIYCISNQQTQNLKLYSLQTITTTTTTTTTPPLPTATTTMQMEVTLQTTRQLLPMPFCITSVQKEEQK